ncbi:MAG: hypothetical protein ACJ8ER_06600 [Allosphingosinicella sp.]
MRRSALRLVAALLAAASSPALAAEAGDQPAPVAEDDAPSIAVPAVGEADAAQAEAELRELQSMRLEMQRKMGDFDARIEALESKLGVPHPPAPAPASATDQASAETEAAAGAPAETGEKTEWGRYEPGRGFILVRGEHGELGAGVYAYARFLNQKGLDETYVDSFGRTKSLQDIRNDLQFQKLSWNFKGWLFDPNFRYYFFFWTSNPQMGEGAQVVLGGYFQYRFNDKLIVTAGVMPLPTTRTTNYTFPNWLRNDNRIMADEFFRGSYSTGIDAQGEILKGLKYRVALANNLAQLGVSSQELDAKFNTFSGALWWMPTTGEFGPAAGMGDFEDHKKLATLVGIHFTRSREDAQGQPDIDDFENSQIRLSDGTLLFSPDPFGTGGKVVKATYQMLALNAGMKYRGFHLEGEYYFRWVDHLDTIGTIPVTKLYDNGFSLQASAMALPRVLQPYVTYSKIFGEYGDPWELGLGLNIYPFHRKEMRFNLQGLKLNHSPIGGSSLVAQVGGDGWVFNGDWIVNF